MKLTVTTLSDSMFTLEVSDDMELENFKALCEFESNIPAGEQAILWNARPLQDEKKTLKDYGLSDGEVLLLQRINRQPARQPQQQNPRQATSSALPNIGIDFGSIQVPGSSGFAAAQPGGSSGRAEGNVDDPATVRDMLLNSPQDLAVLKERNPPLADALLSGSLEKFTEVLRKQQSERADRERDRIRLVMSDPFDASAQQQIAEEIRLKNVESNMETAMEYAPESFGQVLMLYINCNVNGHPVKAFVDSGAQMTIMSQTCAERCNIMRLVDNRWAGIAKGVGTQKIIGRVHLCQIQIGPDYLQSSFSILEDQPMDMLLGLDMLKRHQCSIDLKNNQLVIGTTGTETQFLPETELPSHARLNRSISETSGIDEDRQLAEALSKSAADAGHPGNPQSSSSASAAAGSPAPASTFSAATPPQPPSPSQPAYPEDVIARLMNYGFSRQQVIEELQLHQGNIDEALVALLAKSFQAPGQ